MQNEYYSVPSARIKNHNYSLQDYTLDKAIAKCSNDKNCVAFQFNTNPPNYAKFSTSDATLENAPNEPNVTAYLKKSKVAPDNLRNQINDKVREIYKEPGTLTANYEESFNQTTLAATMVGLLGVTLVIYLVRQA